MDKFNLPDEIRYIKRPSTSRALRGALQAGGILFPGLYGKVPEKTPFKYDEGVLASQGRNLWLNGYFQSFRYFDKHRHALSRELTVGEDFLSPRDLELIQMARDNNSVFLHVRRGDYKNSVLDVITLAYYRNAINSLQERVGECVALIFSDDVEWVKNNMQLDCRCIFVDHNDESKCMNDLEIMTHCKHAVIANSTFSWWGAWLGSPADTEENSQSRVVICPELWWSGLNYADLDIYPQNWIKMPVK